MMAYVIARSLELRRAKDMPAQTLPEDEQD
jgi:hypothetical protein